MVKSRLQQRYAGEAPYTGVVDCAMKTAAREGWRGFYRGFAANLLRVAPQSAITLTAYEVIREALARKEQRRVPPEAPPRPHTDAGGRSGDVTASEVLEVERAVQDLESEA